MPTSPYLSLGLVQTRARRSPGAHGSPPPPRSRVRSRAAGRPQRAPGERPSLKIPLTLRAVAPQRCARVESVAPRVGRFHAKTLHGTSRQMMDARRVRAEVARAPAAIEHRFSEEISEAALPCNQRTLCAPRRARITPHPRSRVRLRRLAGRGDHRNALRPPPRTAARVAVCD
jgi:hypothetical protein